MPFLQENRPMKIDTPLGEDVLLLTGLNGIEGISVPFRYELELISEERDIDFEKIIGKSVNISIDLASEDERLINGVVTLFEKLDAGLGDPAGITIYPYRATITPSFWLLDLTGDCKIFQNKTVPKIVESIFDEHKIIYKNDLRGSYSAREYCVQYNESDFMFVSRILEEEGIFYFFEHEEDKHTIVLADANSSFQPCPGQETAKYRLTLEGKETEDMITSFNCKQKIGPTKYAVSDFNFLTPNTNLEAKSPAVHKFHPNEFEIYCYPGNSQSIKESLQRTEMRALEEEAHAMRITGSSNCRAFASGQRFQLQQFYRMEMNDKEYFLTYVSHSASQTFEGGAGFHYSNSYSCLPIEVKYKPMRTTHTPVMQGSQTATVTGPKGQEIYVDKHGRVKVQFHWDRYGKKDENTSCWIRVSYPSASKGFGFQSHPRIGDEVIVDFLEGDPDRPIITGAVYNAANPTPYTLPNNRTRSTMKSNSSIGGGGYNEFRFEDLKGSEEVYLQAQKDYNVLVKHNRTETVYVNKAETIGVAKELTIGAGYQVTVGGAMNESVGLSKTEEVGLNKKVLVGNSYSINVVEEFQLNNGASVLHMKKDGKIELSGTDLVFKTAGGQIHIDAGGIITIKGAMVKINT